MNRNSGKRNIVSSKALKIRKIRRDQQLAWNEDEEANDYGLKIIVLENVFDINRVKGMSTMSICCYSLLYRARILRRIEK